MQLTILGNGAGGPFQGRHYTAQILEVENLMYLIDCGEGTQEQMYNYRIKSDKIRQIFISHLHGDHVFGLVGLITSYCLKQRTAPLQLFSPPGLKDLIEHTLRVTGVVTPYPLEFVEVNPDVHDKIFENNRVEVWTIPLNHRSPCSGWLFREKLRPRNMRKNIVEELGIPYKDIPSIKAGADWQSETGKRYTNEELTTDPPLPASYAFCSDTAPSERIAEVVSGVDLLYHEATFLQENMHEAGLSFHSTAEQAAQTALKAKAGALMLGHFSARYKTLEGHLDEATAVFTNTILAEEGKVYNVKELL